MFITTASRLLEVGAVREVLEQMCNAARSLAKVLDEDINICNGHHKPGDSL